MSVTILDNEFYCKLGPVPVLSSRIRTQIGLHGLRHLGSTGQFQGTETGERKWPPTVPGEV